MMTPTPTTYTGPLWVPGKPEPKGSMTRIPPKHPGGKAVWINDNPRYDGWERVMVDALGWAWGAGPIVDPVELVADFYLTKPKGTKFRDAPAGTGIGDLDKLVRGVGDALTKAGVIKDDARICRVIAEKVWAQPGRTGAMIELRPYVPPVEIPRGPMPVRIQTGRINALVGSISDVRGLPNLLRAVADRVERAGHDA